MTPPPNILNMFRQMTMGGRSMSQRAGTFARMVGRISMGAMGGPLGLGIMAGSMILPAMMASRGAGGGGQPAGGALESLSDELEAVTSGLHRMNVEIKQLSDSVGQTSADTLKMGGMFAAIGSSSPTQAAAELAAQMGRQTGAMRLGPGESAGVDGRRDAGHEPRRDDGAVAGRANAVCGRRAAEAEQDRAQQHGHPGRAGDDAPRSRPEPDRNGRDVHLCDPGAAELREPPSPRL